MTPPPIQIQKLTERQIRAMLPGWAQSYGVVVDYVHAYNRALTCTTSAARARARQAMGAALDVMTSKAAKLALALADQLGYIRADLQRQGLLRKGS